MAIHLCILFSLLKPDNAEVLIKGGKKLMQLLVFILLDREEKALNTSVNITQSCSITG